jgi:hypothetical protein
MVSPRNYFLYTPLLPAVCTGTMEERSIVEPVRNLVQKKVRAQPRHGAGRGGALWVPCGTAGPRPRAQAEALPCATAARGARKQLRASAAGGPREAAAQALCAPAEAPLATVARPARLPAAPSPRATIMRRCARRLTPSARSWWRASPRTPVRGPGGGGGEGRRSAEGGLRASGARPPQPSGVAGGGSADGATQALERGKRGGKAAAVLRTEPLNQPRRPHPNPPRPGRGVLQDLLRHPHHRRGFRQQHLRHQGWANGAGWGRRRAHARARVGQQRVKRGGGRSWDAPRCLGPSSWCQKTPLLRSY